MATEPLLRTINNGIKYHKMMSFCPIFQCLVAGGWAFQSPSSIAQKLPEAPEFPTPQALLSNRPAEGFSGVLTSADG